MQMLAEDIGLSEEASNSTREWPGDQRCWPQQSLITPHSLGTKSVNTLNWKKKSSISLDKRAQIIKKSEEDQKKLMERKSFQALLQIVPNLLKLKVHPLTPLPHWMRDPYVIGDSLYPEAVFQPITGLELPLWNFLNTRLISKDAIFPYANAQNLLNRIHLYKDDDVTVPNPHFFPILNLRTIESDNDRTWTNTYINLSLSFQQNLVSTSLILLICL
jgi:hypothetical protein